MTSPTYEPRGLGVGPDTIRRWQDRGLIRGPVDRPLGRPNLDGDHSSGETPSVEFPPINEDWLPATEARRVDEPLLD
jgi:hypothetical protein